MPEGDEQDPFAPVDASPRFATPLAVIGFVLAAVTLVGGLAPVTGPVGMAVGLIAHVKHSRLGLPAALASGVAMVVAMAFTLFMR